MQTPDMLRYTKIPLNHGSGAMPAVGFGTLIPDPVATKQATKTALEVGFRHFDCAERYRNEEAVGEAMQEVFKAGAIRREDVFVTTKLWNTNHRPERVKPAFDASRGRLQIDTVDCYLIHTPFAFRAGDEQDPRDEHDQVIYDSGVTLVETWRALERLVDGGKCKSIRCYFGSAARDRRRRAHQACSGASRVPSVFPSMGPARLLSRARDCSASRRAVGTWLGSESSGRPRDHNHRTACPEDACSSRACLGCTARHCVSSHLTHGFPYSGELCHFASA
jgi:aryl-alcohol dehydrogenase-like predicted oxidoreductase